MAKNLTILGSTGSIGESALRVVSSFSDDFQVYGLSCKSSLDIIDGQIEKYGPEVVAIESTDKDLSGKQKELEKKYPGVEFLNGEDGVLELASRTVDIVLSAIVGAAGLKPSMAALNGARRIALANKETLVMAGEIFMDLVERKGVELIPVDSEHSAIHSLLRNIPSHELRRVVLTASGGSLRDHSLEKLSRVSPDAALAHPTWDMGNKITIDSATLMNKGLEVIEAHHLFRIGYDMIDVIIHPESIIHSMVETVDGSIYAHMGIPDMALPILNALAYPEKKANDFGTLSLDRIGALHFSSYEPARYPALELCFGAGRTGGTMPAVLNAANEVAVETFLAGKILFTDITRIVERTMNSHEIISDPDMDSIIRADNAARETAKRIIDKEL